MELIKNIAAIVGCISASIGLLAMIIKPFRKWLVGWVKKKSNSSELEKKLDSLNDLLLEHIEGDSEFKNVSKLQTEALLCILRDSITKMYYKHKKEESIPSYAKENLVKIYNCYHSMHGNSYIDIIYEELLALPVDN